MSEEEKGQEASEVWFENVRKLEPKSGDVLLWFIPPLEFTAEERLAEGVKRYMEA